MDRDFSREDLQKNKMLSAVGYVVFFVPLICCRDSKLGKYCANQGLLILIVQILLALLFGILGGIPLLGWVFLLVGRLARLAVLVISLLCMVQLMTNDRVIELPYIGYIRIIPQ